MKGFLENLRAGVVETVATDIATKLFESEEESTVNVWRSTFSVQPRLGAKLSCYSRRELQSSCGKGNMRTVFALRVR